MDEVWEYGMRNTGWHVWLKLDFGFGVAYGKQTD